ncbi:MAG: helix-turn-helix domain-containing protein [Defluviitaleaceae bacterium]|nr:helix-turn-helix domain-containing protein [Defluviitaleaceae bacterium]
MTIGEKISALRRQKGMSQKQLAEAIIISPQAVSRWEQDENMPDLENIVRLSSIFDVSTDYLLKNGEFVTAKGEDDKDDKDDKDDDDWDTKHDRNDRPYNFIISNIYGIALVAFLIIGFGFDHWRYAWLMFIAAWGIKVLVNLIRNRFDLIFDFDTLATVAFLVMGFGWQMWHPGWMAFPIAWLLKGLTRDFRRNREYKRRDMQ